MNRPFYDPFVYEFAKGLAILIENQRAQNTARQFEEEVVKAQLKALKAQIQPHFLFNSLSTISSLCRTDALKARELIIDLAQFFRKTIEEDSSDKTLASEMEAIEAYLRIEKARLGERLNVVYDVDPEILDCTVPGFCIQPLVENAIKHGISQRVKPGVVILKCGQVENQLWVEVINSKADSEACRGCGHAVNNIKERLSYLYGNQADFCLSKEENEVRATLKMPLRRAI